MSKRLRLFTHTDLDGIGCSVLAMIAFGRGNVDVDYCNYDDIDQKVIEYFNSNKLDECHITDIRVSQDLAHKIAQSNKNFRLIDHHKSALDLNEHIWCEVQTHRNTDGLETSGTELYYEYLSEMGHIVKSSSLDAFVDIVTNYDTWRWNSLGEDGLICKQINSLLYIFGRDMFINWCYETILDDSFPRILDTEKLILSLEQQKIDKYIEDKDKYLMTGYIDSRPCGFIYAESYISELGNKLCLKHPELDLIVIINMDGYVSYRTVKDNIDLSQIAKKFGGGGHIKAAGSQLSQLQREVSINVLFNER